MSERLPALSGKEFVRILERFGWGIHHQKGSHVIMRKHGSPFTLSIPNHKTLDKGTLHSLLKDAEIEIKELRKHL